jgi:hypothetical protein
MERFASTLLESQRTIGVASYPREKDLAVTAGLLFCIFLNFSLAQPSRIQFRICACADYLNGSD